MDDVKQNYYGSLCTEMYEILHKKAPQDELDFFLSYAKKEQKILEPLCGSGRFFVPFYRAGYDISGMDLSSEMLEKLKQKIPDAKVNIVPQKQTLSNLPVFLGFQDQVKSLFGFYRCCYPVLLVIRTLIGNSFYRKNELPARRQKLFQFSKDFLTNANVRKSESEPEGMKR